MGTNITGIGNANAIGFKSRVTGGTYFPPELKDALVGVWSAYGKSNDSTDRNIIKNKIKDRGGDFVISNAAYKLNSGYGLYGMDFLEWKSNSGMSFTSTKLTSTKPNLSGGWLTFRSVSGLISETKVKVSGAPKEFVFIGNNGADDKFSVTINNGVYTIPEFTLSSASGFYINNNSGDWSNLVIEQIPSFEGAFVTDGIDDLITSTKTVQEMGITDEITVVSMIHKISSDNNWTNLIGELKEDHTFVANRATNTDKTGIYGYTYNYVGDAIVINNILGDKNDYIVRTSTSLGLDNKYYVTGFRSAGIIQNISQIAWYWTFIANRVLTEDEINLVIEKYNLDRPGEIVKPQVYYNIKKQKISNDNHSAFDDKLIDYSGNGYDAKLYNFGWKEDSGIGKYETDFTDWKKSFKVTSFDSESIKFTSDVSWALLYHPSSIGEDTPSFKVRIKLYGKGTLYYNYITQEGKYTNVAVKSEIFETPICYNTKYTGEKGVNVGFTLGVTSGECSGTITQIPEYENALVLDGVDDYGKVTGLPILKDYTVAADYIRTFAKESAQDSPILSKSKVAGSGAFLFNYLNADSITSSYSFGTNNILKEINDSERKIYYLSKYASDGHNVNAGSAVDYDTMWLGTYRDNISNFFTGALYFAMLFPYSLSEFLLERQIKKARAGTLYPNQVEFKPIIPEDENITKIDYFVVNSGTWTVIKPGDYVDVGARIVLNVYTKLPYKIAGASSTAFTGMTVGPSTALNIWDVKGYIKDKTPQKIKLTLAVNEDIVQWNPAITSNLLDSFTASSWYLNGWDNTLTAGTWIKKTDRVFFKATFKTELYGLETATFGGTECVVSKADNWSDSKNIWDIRMLGTVGDLSQIFNLDVYELIRFEDIVQPYPVLLRFKDENGNEVSWGGKFRVGSTITRIGSAADSNLLPNIYNIFGLLLNDNQVTSSKVIVEKTMVFKAKSAYIFDNNEPKCILSPSRLRIPNSSYKILGYIPDISGHGNHGVIHNSAYAEGSGVNEDGSYQFDGVDDFVTIPTVTGGKQVLMKVNWNTINSIIYDQRGSGGFAIYCSNYNNPSDPITVPAYKGRNAAGTTYIDGIRNEYIIASQLRNVTHNIVEILDTSYAAGNINPIIGKSYLNANYGKMSLYDFVLFDEVSTDEEIKQLNDIIGIEGDYVQKPDYYWDAYGKSNFDADRGYIKDLVSLQQANSLENFNFAYDKMSGYEGYSFKSFNDSQSWNIRGDSTGVEIISRNGYSMTVKKLVQNLDWQISNNEYRYPTILDKEVPFKCKSNKNVGLIWQLKYKTEGATSDTTVTLINQQLTPNVPLEISLPYKTQDELTELGAVSTSVYYLLYFSNTTLEIGEEYTVEMLPLYPNGLVFDGVDDYSRNTSIPALADYTYICKRSILNIPTNGATLSKGSHKTNGGAFIADYGNKWQFNFGQYNTIQGIADGINWQTTNNFNGTPINKGNNTDDEGITVGRFSNGYANMVFYKLFLYPRTVDMLSINMVKNMMEEDGIIDLTSKLFTDKYTGDFYEMDFNNDFLIGN